MLEGIKEKITELAYAAVNMAEECLETESGQDKKQAAIEYVVSMLPVIPIFKTIICFLLSKFIDEAIENAVTYMNKLKKEG